MKRSLILLALLSWGCNGQAPPAATSPSSAATTAEPAAVAANPVEAGKKLYESTCSACHAADGAGVPGLGKPLKGSSMLTLSDAELVDFIKQGRDTSDPKNTTKVAMPPKGGNPALSDNDLGQIVAYLRSLK
ncbi:MAG: cytochrome c [Candidatus Eremiobacteraeota bacterium]|nr:cytochrome c [Candidatus Eremiobacteraeota bacterium]MCW5871198.1 cytochrome c [Candidatus Eremiobacteraeota bacterium]